MADWYSTSSKSTSRGRRNNGDFEESEIWSVMKEMEGGSSSSSTPKLRKPSPSVAASPATWRVATSPRAINPTGTTDGKVIGVERSSAPMNIPDWSKIYGADSAAAVHGSYYDDNNDDDENDEDDDENDDVPPHEWLAKRLARSQISSFSVCEGIGRTLKGRDLSKVRNAILTKTGFLE